MTRNAAILAHFNNDTDLNSPRILFFSSERKRYAFESYLYTRQDAPVMFKPALNISLD